MAAEVRYRSADLDDLSGIAEVFLAAFPESVLHYVGHTIGTRVIEDAFAIALDAEPEALLVAETDGRIAGYAYAPSKFSNVARTAVFRCHLCRMFGRWISGGYGVGLRPAWIAARNWLSIWRESREEALHAEARILSIAVSPDFQGMGIGTELMKRAMAYFAAKGEERVRLEVRPENAAAIHLYEKLGFETKGRTRDTQGDWLIMIRELPEKGDDPAT
jgi:ribosomal protein S18 acetylase RimI-like enzyme